MGKMLLSPKPLRNIISNVAIQVSRDLRGTHPSICMCIPSAHLWPLYILCHLSLPCPNNTHPSSNSSLNFTPTHPFFLRQHILLLNGFSFHRGYYYSALSLERNHTHYTVRILPWCTHYNISNWSQWKKPTSIWPLLTLGKSQLSLLLCPLLSSKIKTFKSPVPPFLP